MSKNKRGAGILLHITSLPSHFGIGDLGPSAKKFADFLYKGKQKYWQILPINPIEEGQGYSPYSSTSSRAGNTLLISPEALVADGLLNAAELSLYHLPSTDKADFAKAEKIKVKLFTKAWNNYKAIKNESLQEAFRLFSTKEAQWLEDYALYMLLKKEHNGLPWYQWKVAYKQRDEIALQVLATEHKDELEKIKFLQFIFSKQWHELKEYVNKLNLQFFGDLPFYVSYDSADVWANKEIFKLDEEGNMAGIAGVPPDAFSDDGQFWGMPVFRWDVLKQQGYEWWIERIRKNMELFDVLRLDHFRAFADYWEVPADAETAKNGEWKPGPGAALFTTLHKALGEYPFIAEDLGDINEPVYTLRDQFHFPGMKILQFAFGYNMPSSLYIPHNYSSHFVVYTGTHDNNTIKGWYRTEGKQYQHQLEQYFGKPITEAEIHLDMGRLAYASVADTAILPLQDVLGQDEGARMNTPASVSQNWLWRLLPNQITTDVALRLKEWVEVYNRE